MTSSRKKPKSIQAIRKAITEWKKDPSKMEAWATDQLFKMALVLEGQIDFPGQGAGAQQAQLAAVKQMYDIITVMLEDILPNKEELGFGGQGKKVPKYEADEPENALPATAGSSPRFTPSASRSGTKLGEAPVELLVGDRPTDEESDLLDPRRER